MAVGMRIGAPLVFAIGQSPDEDPVAEGIWVLLKVLPHRLSIVNPLIEEAGIVR